jgi:hypothetical protein
MARRRAPSSPPGRRRLLVAAAIALGALAAGCSSGSEPVVQTLPPGTSGAGTTATTSHLTGTTEREPTGTATIGSFEVRNQISCAGDIDVTTAADYETDGATSVEFLVDGDQVPGTPPLNGSFDIPVSCDGRSHTVVLVAIDAEGETNVDSRVVLTSTTPQGN